MRSIFSHGMYILFFVCEKTMNEPQGGRIICAYIKLHVADTAQNPAVAGVYDLFFAQLIE